MPASALFRRLSSMLPTGQSLAVLYMMLGAMSATLGNTFLKHVALDLHPFEITFFRCFFSLFILAPVLLRHGLIPLRTRRFGMHCLRGGLQSFGMICSHWAIAIAPLAKITALSFTGPLFATLLAAYFLRERIRLRRIAALLFGFSGALIIVRPDTLDIDLGSGLALLGAFEFGITMIIIKMMTRTESALTLTIWLGLISTPITGAIAWFVWTTPTFEHLCWLFGFSATATVSNLLAAHAVRLADMSVVMPIRFTRLIFAALLGYLFFAEIPDLETWIGGAMIFAASLYVAYRERKVKQSQLPPPSA
ncbi:MAG: drug/metabolite transporter (DMT)-like permease [Gammaproteobacteria bacterium]|jgi:drug/metabolite transporter (DMT)-like permease